MIKTLLSLSALGVAPALATTTITNITNHTDSIKSEEKEANIQSILETENINLPLKINTPATGTHNLDNQNAITTISINKWSSIKEATDLTLYGLFSLNTYKAPKSFPNIALRKDDSSSNSNQLKFNYHEMNDQKSGWGHQTSEIAITVTITHDPNGSDKAIIKIDNYVRARTAGSVHQCSTISNINKLELKN